jgi:hypothetical protein
MNRHNKREVFFLIINIRLFDHRDALTSRLGDPPVYTYTHREDNGCGIYLRVRHRM